MFFAVKMKHRCETFFLKKMRELLNNTTIFLKRNKKSIVILEIIILSALIYRAYDFAHKQQQFINSSTQILPYSTPVTLSEGNVKQAKTASIELSAAQ